MMRVIRVANYQEVSKKAFEEIKTIITVKPGAVLGLATGSSPVGLYQYMIKDHQEAGTSYADIKTFNLDEYVGLPKSDPHSYYSFMHHNLFDHIDIKEENIHIPSGEGDLLSQCELYNELLSETQIDIQVLGIGSNGHIGFNEPGTSFDSETHIVELKQSTIQDNARFFDNDISKVPARAITMGIANVMNAKKILLLATGENKASAIASLLMGIRTENVPASALQDHPDVTIIIDKAASSLLYKEKR